MSTSGETSRLSPSSFQQCSSLSLRLQLSPSLKPAAGSISQDKGTGGPQVGDRHGGAATATCGTPLPKYPSHKYLSYPINRIFPIKFSGSFLKVDLNTLGRMIFITPLWNFSVLSSLTAIILGDFARPLLCPGCAISEFLISQPVKIKKEIDVHTGPINNTHDWIHADYSQEQYIAGMFHGSGVGCLSSPIPWGDMQPMLQPLSSLPGPGWGWSAGAWGIPTPCWGLLLGARKELRKGQQREGRGKGFLPLWWWTLTFKPFPTANTQNEPQQMQAEFTRAFSDIHAFNSCKYWTKWIKYCKLH